VLGFGAV